MFRGIVLAVAVGLVALGCQNGQGPNDDQKVAICQGVLRLAKPECARLEPLDPAYAALCNEGVEDAITACQAGIEKRPELVCPRIASKADECALIPGAKPEDVATCQRVVGAAAIACQVGVSFISQPGQDSDQAPAEAHQ